MFAPPLEPEAGDALLNRVGEQEVFVTAHYDRAGWLLALERWDRGLTQMSSSTTRTASVWPDTTM